MKDVQPAETLPLLISLAGKRAPRRRVFNYCTSGIRGPDNLGGRLHERLVAGFTLPQLLSLSTIRDVLDG